MAKTIISTGDWTVKDKDFRTVPVCPELNQMLLGAFEQAGTGEEMVIPAGSIVASGQGVIPAADTITK